MPLYLLLNSSKAARKSSEKELHYSNIKRKTLPLKIKRHYLHNMKINVVFAKSFSELTFTRNAQTINIKTRAA